MRRPKVGEIWRYADEENYKIIAYDSCSDKYTLESMKDGYIKESYSGSHFDILWTLLFGRQVEHYGKYKLVDRGTHYETEEIK